MVDPLVAVRACLHNVGENGVELALGHDETAFGHIDAKAIALSKRLDQIRLKAESPVFVPNLRFQVGEFRRPLHQRRTVDGDFVAELADFGVAVAAAVDVDAFAVDEVEVYFDRI